MAQLETYNINEIFFISLLVAAFTDYISENDTDDFESLKSYLYSTSIIFNRTNKTKKLSIFPTIILLNNKASFFSWDLFLSTKIVVLELTKPIDNLLPWKNLSLRKILIDKSFINLKNKFGYFA